MSCVMLRETSIFFYEVVKLFGGGSVINGADRLDLKKQKNSGLYFAG